MNDRRLTALLVSVLAAAIVHNWRAWRRQTAANPTPAPKPRPLWQTPRVPKISFLVAAWNESQTIERHIQSFMALNYPAKELVLCAGGEDDTLERARAMASHGVVVIKQRPGEGKQRSLRRCLENSNGQIIVLSDADCLYEQNAFERLVEPIMYGEADATSGFRRPLPEQRQSLFVRLQWLAEVGSEGALRGVHGFWGGNSAFRRAALERSGALRARAMTGTDYVQGRLLIRSGYPIRWVPDSNVETRYPADVGTYLQAWRRWIKNILIHGPRLGDWRGTARILIAVVLASGTLLFPITAPVTGRAALAIPLTAICVASINRVRRIATGSRSTGLRTSWSSFAVAPALVVLDQLAVLLAVVDSLSRKARRRW